MSPQTSTCRVTLVGLVSLAVAMGIGRFAFTPLLPLMQDDGLVDVTGGGMLAAVHFLGYWLGAVLAARVDRAPRIALRGSLITIGLCTLGMGATQDLAPWLILRWLSGVCSAFVLVLVGNFYIKHLAGIGRPEMQGWVFSGVGAGICVAGLGALAIMAGGIGSGRSWQIFGAATLLVALAVCARMGTEIPADRVAAPGRRAPRTPLAWSVVIAYGAAGIGYIIPATYLPIMAREIVQSPLVFGWIWPVFGLAAFVSTLVTSKLERHVSNRRIWVASQGIMAVGLLLPVVAPGIVMMTVAGICVGGTFMIITMAGMKEAHRIAPAHDVTRHIAVLTASFATGQMIGPVFASSMHDLTGSFSVSLLVTSVALLVTATALMFRASNPEALRARNRA